KEYWFYLDSTPTHSYMKCQYKYPQRAFPYEDLVSTNARRGKQDMEYELLDTGIFDDDRYFDVIVEYAKGAHDDILMLVRAHNRGPDAATLHLLPTLWFRNTWSWGGEVPKPTLTAADGERGVTAARASHPDLGDWWLRADSSAELLFCENETNNKRLFGTPNTSPYVKDAINDFVVHGTEDAVNPARSGTKVAAHHVLELAAGDSASIRVRLSADGSAEMGSSGKEKPLGSSFKRIVSARRNEADQFYATVIPATLGPDGAMVMRQALAGLLWGKQYYEYDVHRWLREHGVNPWDPNAPASSVRNVPWFHMVAGDVISMPDKWEYPWFAAWDLAFHCAPLSLVDVDFAKQQVELLLDTRYQHPNGQIPAYEWNFSDVNPPVTAWAALYVYEREAEIRGAGDREFLARVFDRLLTNFTWWVNRKDPDDRNLFQGGFLGLDNIGIFDRSAPLPGGGTLEQADGTAWMALYCQWMLQIAAELARHDPVYADMALKFVTHFEWIALAMDPPDGDTVLWNEEDGFYYDILRLPDGETIQLKVRSLVGLLPLCAATVFDGEVLKLYPMFMERIQQFISHFSDDVPALAHPPGPNPEGRRIASLVDEPRLRRILSVMLDEDEFLGAHGIRAISRRHLEQPCVFDWAGQEYNVHYLPAESDTGMFGGNSNWRGPVWFPMNLVILRGLAQLHRYYGERLKVECPTGSGHEMNLLEVATEIATRLASTFTEDENGHRPVFGGIEKFQTDPHWHDLLLFHEYFHGDNGAGIGASHQTGWTGTVALLFLLGGALHAQPSQAAAG
ncbi:MAG: MGH1-like glycoside hydrolase domain-containing protein, partial [Solirubrobacteraceae bacterium]